MSSITMPRGFLGIAILAGVGGLAYWFINRQRTQTQSDFNSHSGPSYGPDDVPTGSTVPKGATNPNPGAFGSSGIPFANDFGIKIGLLDGHGSRANNPIGSTSSAGSTGNDLPTPLAQDSGPIALISRDLNQITSNTGTHAENSAAAS